MDGNRTQAAKHLGIHRATWEHELVGHERRLGAALSHQDRGIVQPVAQHEQQRLELGQISLEGLKNWVDYGVRYYSNHPERQQEYFALESADSRAVLQSERHGTLFADNQRRLDLFDLMARST